MGFSSIAKTPVSHGVEPHDLETVRTFAFVFSSLKLPASPRRNYRASGFALTSIPDVRSVLRPRPLPREAVAAIKRWCFEPERGGRLSPGRDRGRRVKRLGPR